MVVTAEGSARVRVAAHAADSAALPIELADEHDRYLHGRSKKESRARS